MEYESIILDTREFRIGHIYKITNIKNNKLYICQAVSHRKNHEKYRPFGYKGRFRDHISEALCNTKKKQCTYLNNAIRLYGKENFKVELLQRCPINELNQLEQKLINDYDSLYPNGYNLTIGGKTTYQASIKNNNIKTERLPYNHSATTKDKIGAGLIKFYKNPDNRKKISKDVKGQHLKMKLEKFKNCSIDINDIDQYIKPVINKDTKEIHYYRVVINGMTTCFRGKHNSSNELYNESKNFILELYQKGKNSIGLDNPQPSS